MGHNIFVSYKYKDQNVRQIPDISPYTHGRDYVDVLQDKLSDNGQIYMGEKGDDDLSNHTDDYIYEHLKDKIFPTTCTIVLISAGMKEPNRYDKSQWIPWEIYYSIREISSNNGTSHRNGIVGVVIPDRNGSYDFAIQQGTCCENTCRIIVRNWMFNILKNNMFNIKQSNTYICSNGDKIYKGDCSYISLVKWDDFINNMNFYIDEAENRKEHCSDYDLHIDVNV
jgi:hypothetical protein